jgi:anti-sigma regulatory factor (Ser/Thr protein kinase)
LNDEIQLVLPAQEDFHHIAHLVVGGLAARLDLTYEQLEDLQLAVEAVLACRDDDGEISVLVTAGQGSVHATIGPFAAAALAALDGDGASLGLRRVLETVADTFEVTERGGGSWVELTKETQG